MRRTDRERNDTGGGRGFRIIEAGGRYLEPLTPPPPPRAPEPYKVVPSSSSLGRAHRRSSFVIIAETRPATPSSRSTSPTLLPTGRVSPFRGRGFKGPLPHGQSRPQSPENRQRNERGHGRYDRRASVSQQNSPKRSLIPQPTRRRSVSLPKNNETKVTPKFGRRAPLARKNANVPASQSKNGLTRRHSLKAPDLSPIQGTPTKPNEPVGRHGVGSHRVAKVSPAKTRNTLTVPKFVGNGKRTTSQDRATNKGSSMTKRFVEEKRSNVDDEAKTKIPMRRGSIVNKNKNLPTNRFVTANVVKTGPRAVTSKNEGAKLEGDSNVSEQLTGDSGKQTDDKEESCEDLPDTRFVDMNLSSEAKKRDNDRGLMDLLKQSSGATGTSSVVNTTTTTAVQPLQLEAAAVLLEKDRDNGNNKKSTSSTSTASLATSPNSGLSPTVTSDSSTLPKTLKTTNGNQSTGAVENKVDNRDKGAMGSTTPSQITSNTGQKNVNKSNGDGTSTNNTKKEQVNSTNNGQASRDKTLAGVTGNTKKNPLTRNDVREGSRGEMRVSSANTASRGNNSSNNVNGNQKNIGKDQTVSGRTESSVVVENVVSVKPETTGKIVEGVATVTSGNGKSDSRGSAINSKQDDGHDGKRTLARNVGGASAKNTETTTNNATVIVAANGDNNNKIRANNGSDNSLKSSNGLSNVSADSIRSTDTGVSVNTVRGVSSAREKRGMHTMKRSEEIETLSGNVMHLERNGEPAVLDIADGNEEPENQTRLDRIKKSLTHFRDRLPSMRCLGCRRNQKGQSWNGDERSQARGLRNNELTPAGDTTNNGNSRCNRMWNSLKNACRCTRLRECKCCRRAARVAPSESTPCCPPERRCGALCGRIFSRCKCNRSEAQHTRSIRAKHSLTSVAPPPLSEEQRPKIPDVLVEHNSVMRGAIPCLPVPIAWFCLVWNVLLPGSGTVWSGLFNLCIGQPRFSASAGPRARFGALVVNLIVGIGQFFTVLFCLVGWGWSIWWGVTMIRLARKYKRFRASEAASSDLEARGGETTGLPAGVPSQAMRGMERAR